MDGQNILQTAFETQWQIADKKQKDYSYIFNEDFLTFIDTCINFFNNSYVPFLNGSTITFEDKKQAIHEGSVFNSAFFLNLLNDIARCLIIRRRKEKSFSWKWKNWTSMMRRIDLRGLLYVF